MAGIFYAEVFAGATVSVAIAAMSRIVFQSANVTHQQFGLFCAQHTACALAEFCGGILPAQMHL